MLDRQGPPGRPGTWRRGVAWALALTVGLVACGSSSGPAAAPPSPSVSSARCIVRLHGKGEKGADTTVNDGVAIIAPTGNATGWGARQWLYFPERQYTAARDEVAEAAAGCGQVIVDGFSNGGAFAAKLYCRGETLGGHLVGVVVDDPVVDAGVVPCAPDPSVAVTLYWTGALDAQSEPGASCAKADWTCEGGTTIGIDAYAKALRTERRASPYHTHQWFLDAPELTKWR
jgi:hypothetical protein